jgi:uncharacterized protein
VAGLGASLAKAVVAHRSKKGAFTSRDAIKSVPRFGDKTFEQAAGFLRVSNGTNPLDNSAVHPERYALVERIAIDQGCAVAELIGNAVAVRGIDIDRYVDDEVGRYTLGDILAELEKPGRDPRSDFEAIEYRDDVNAITDLEVGMELPGSVTNVTHFGAFVDVGVHQDGLVHVSQIAHRYISEPAEELKVGQSVRVKVMEVDVDRKRIGLSIKALMPTPSDRR